MTDVVQFAAGLAPLAVLTNKPTAPTERILDALGLAPHFRWVLGGDAAFPRKPDPGALRYLMEQAGVRPAQTIFVGDSMVDIGPRAARTSASASRGTGSDTSGVKTAWIRPTGVSIGRPS